VFTPVFGVDLASAVVRARQVELQKETDTVRPVGEAIGDRAGVWEALTSRVGQALVSIGLRLRGGRRLALPYSLMTGDTVNVEAFGEPVYLLCGPGDATSDGDPSCEMCRVEVVVVRAA
jgi:hypothetical protein